MRDDPFLFYHLWSQPATWQSEALDLGALDSNQASFHIYWRDVAVTFYLWCANAEQMTATSPPWHDQTAEYRLGDPGWVDPALGDPYSEHIVRFVHLGARYVKLGWTAGNWAGANRYMQIVFFRERGNR